MTVQLNDITASVPVETIDASITGARGQNTTHRPYRLAFKRVLDVLLVVVFLPVWAPILLVSVAILVLTGKTPFYTQMRFGQGGRNFRIFKLCTMVPNADEVLEDYLRVNPEARAEWNSTQKLKNDPRITKMGRFMRKSSLDELPQLLNVLIGDMSLVGPRPMMLSQASLYPGRAYFELRPGITGNWQISDRNECAFTDRAAFDDAYYRDLSFKLDMSILFGTISVVLRGTGY